MFDLKYFDERRKHTTFAENIDKLHNPSTFNKILHEIKYKNQHEVINHISSILNPIDVVINNQMAYKNYGEKILHMSGEKAYEFHKQHGYVDLNKFPMGDEKCLASQ